jgi:hypothetical protein
LLNVKEELEEDIFVQLIVHLNNIFLF